MPSMVIPPARACPGGLGSPPDDGRPGDLATCPVCGAAVTLGYGGRIPYHEPEDQALPATDERVFDEPVDRVA